MMASPPKKRRRLPRLAVSLCTLVLPYTAGAFTTDGSGHYGLRGEWHTNPGMNAGTGMHQAIAQSFRLLGEARANDRASFFLELRLFERNGETYLGDTARSPQCSAHGAESGDCVSDYQSVRHPSYQPYQAHFSKAYARYAFDYFIVEAGRRGRSWGLGLFLDAGEKPFDRSASVFDGISFDINLQQFQALGFRIGYDKLAESGAPIRALEAGEAAPASYGPANNKDDIDQVFLSIEYDDRRANVGDRFTKQIGIYAARVHSGDIDRGGSATDLTYFDVFANLNLPRFVFKHEMLITLGKSADPNLIKLGGNLKDSDGNPAVNKLNTMAFAGGAEWTIARSGDYNGPPEFREGNLREHLLFVNYAFAPGDEDGYYNDRRTLEGNQIDERYRALNIGKRSEKRANAFAFHRNFTPALILFSGKEYVHGLAVDGVFDPGQFMNAQLYSLGYRYNNLHFGELEIKGVYAFLHQGMPADVKSYYEARPEETRPVGYAGNDLGFELDLTYTKHINRNFNLGLAAGYLFAGDAWKIYADESQKNSASGQAFMGFHF